MEENNTNITTSIDIQNIDGIEYLKTIDKNSIDLILTDPPYIISKDTGMNSHYNKVKENAENNVEFVKTEEEWTEYKEKNKIENDDKKDNYMRYGTIYGTKYCVKTDYGDWDSEFTLDKLEEFISIYYNKLKKGGTLIMFFDLWKISQLKELMEKHKFKQIRFIEWIKTNPQPLNSKTNYLTNCREIALLGVKGGKPTFNSKYDNGIYMYPLQGGKNRFHPTQKSLPLFEDIIKKHSNEGDVILDTFLGGGTTAFACKNTNRNFKGCDVSKEYYDKVMKIIELKNM
jgi:DNA modification methylase